MTEALNSREIALSVLLSVTKDGQYCHIALSAALERYQHLTKQDRSFITRLCEGTLERMIEISYILDQFSKVRTEKMKPAIRCILQMGVYQLKYMDSVPQSAACNEAVKLAVKKGFHHLKGYVNGVLRAVSRNLDTVSYPDENSEPLYALSVRYSIPEWMLLQWSRAYGIEKAELIASSFYKKKRISIRVNRMKTSVEQLRERLSLQGIAAEPAVLAEYPDYDYAMYLSDYDYLSAIPEFREGLFTVQDVSSMLVTHIAAPKAGSYVIDVCSAPGGKSLHAAEWMGGSGTVDARDLTEYKVKLIEENKERCGMENICIKRQDARILDDTSIGKADLVIADLPCSGLGTLGKKPDIRFRMTEEKEMSLVKLQREILSTVCQYVKPGGTLLFSTCTIDRMENEENTAWFLQENPKFILTAERQFLPDEGEYDGFYIARMEKRQEEL